MPLNRPGLVELDQAIRADLEAGLKDARLPVNVLDAIARTLSGGFHTLYGYLDFLSRQGFTQLAEADSLDSLHGAFWGVPRQAAAQAEGLVSVEGSPGAEILAGALLTGPGGVEYEVTQGATLVVGTGQVTVKALKPGAAGVAVPGVVLTWSEALAGINATATVAEGGLGGGADIEADAAYRARILQRIQQPPLGGAAHDYEAWARQVAGVTDVWVSPGERGVGTVVVRFLMADAYADGLPSAEDIGRVFSHIESFRPVAAKVFVEAPRLVAFHPRLTISPDTPDVRAAIEAEITNRLARDIAPGGLLYLSRLRESISVAAGEFNHTLLSPVADYQFGLGELPYLDGVEWA